MSDDLEDKNMARHDQADALSVDHHKVLDEKAAHYVDETVHISDAENRRLRRRIHMLVLPVLCVAYITQALDKNSLGPLTIMGWLTSVNAKGQDYALTSTFLQIGLIVGEPLATQLVRRFPVAKVLGISMVCWTALVYGFAFSLSIGPVWAIRLLLGFFESTFAPCLVALTVQWYTKEEQTIITTIWQAMFGLSNLLIYLMAYGFYHVKGKVAHLVGWQWLTIVVAIISSIASIIVLLFMPDSPVDARWASEEEKTKFVERVRVNDQGIQQKQWRGEQAWEAIKDPLAWHLVAMACMQTLVVGGLNTFNSLLVSKAFGFAPDVSQLLGIPLSVFQVALYFLIGWLGTKTKQTILCMIAYAIVNVIGSIVLITVAPTTSTRGGLLFMFYCMQCFQSVTPSMYVMLSRNIAGQTKKSVVYGAFFMFWSGGNAIGPQFFQARWAPRYIPSLYIHIGIYAAWIINLILMRILLVRRNAKRDALLAETGTENHHQHAFEDLTDLQNMEFRYSY